MSRPTLDELPVPPSGKTGWPWTEASEPLPETTEEGNAWPKISIVTPSYNQGRFIEETIRSVLLQGYPNLEYVVIDGGSTDESVEIIRKYAPWIDYWISEQDRGQSHAINKGFRQTSGKYGNWINSDDLLAPKALVRLSDEVDFDQNTIYAGVCNYVDEQKTLIEQHQGTIHSFEDLVDLSGVWRGHPERGHLVQPETLFPLRLFRKAGGLNERNAQTMDYGLWGRMLLEGAQIEYVDIEMCYFRQHGAQKTADMQKTTKSLVKTAIDLVDQHSFWSSSKKRECRHRLRAYQEEQRRKKGRLARLPLPKAFVKAIRSLRSQLT